MRNGQGRALEEERLPGPAGLAALTGFAYWQALGPLGRLLQRRETKILSVVTVEVE